MIPKGILVTEFKESPVPFSSYLIVYIIHNMEVSMMRRLVLFHPIVAHSLFVLFPIY